MTAVYVGRQGTRIVAELPAEKPAEAVAAMGKLCRENPKARIEWTKEEREEKAS